MVSVMRYKIFVGDDEEHVLMSSLAWSCHFWLPIVSELSKRCMLMMILLAQLEESPLYLQAKES